jgi:glutamate dehydrogenase
MDYIGIKTYRADGTPKGEIRVVGLFTSQSISPRPTHVPFLRHKVDAVLGALGYPPGSHDGKAILNILESFPRDELFQIGVKQLREWVDGILDLETRPRVRVFARNDRFDRFVSLLIYVPRDRYTHRARAHRRRCCRRPTTGASSAFYPHFPTARWCACSSSSRAMPADAAGRQPGSRARHRRDHPHLGGPAGEAIAGPAGDATKSRS